jgi:hypothetical protein
MENVGQRVLVNEAIVMLVYTCAKAHAHAYASYTRIIDLVFNSCGRNHVQAHRLYVCMCVSVSVCVSEVCGIFVYLYST